MGGLEGHGAFSVAARAAGILWALAFVVIGLTAELQLYADGSIFSYAIADGATWDFHWHNIAQRLTTHVLTHAPAEAYVAVTGHGRGGIVIYGALFFAAPLAGLVLTRALDRTPGHVHVFFAGLSTALLATLVFGFPTELWLSLALLWPVMACLHGGRRWPWPVPLVLLLALAFTHEGGLLLAVVAVGMLVLRGGRDAELRRALGLLGVTVTTWLAVKLWIRPDDYFASAYARSAVGFLDLGALASPVMLLLYAAVASYLSGLVLMARLGLRHASVLAVVAVAAGVVGIQLWSDPPVHASERYSARTVMLGAAAVLACASALAARASEAQVTPSWAVRLSRAIMPESKDAQRAWIRAVTGAFAVVMAVHAVETARFVTAWRQYKEGVRALAMSATSDPRLGHERFADAERLGAQLNRLSWYSTTQYLSVLLAPDWVPDRLVVDPDAGYYWLSCAMAKTDEEKPGAIPRESRRLIRIHACLHR